jgi:hypothetical protein
MQPNGVTIKKTNNRLKLYNINLAFTYFKSVGLSIVKKAAPTSGEAKFTSIQR